ncbi:hypothetical protein [Streptomyces sp. NPDC014676]|uniref:hypothetical protein n=1 Tax=Streptomyces sp. NPDC014676 TaxID=3364879 RepID=UPI0036F4D05D
MMRLMPRRDDRVEVSGGAEARRVGAVRDRRTGAVRLPPGLRRIRTRARTAAGEFPVLLHRTASLIEEVIFEPNIEM